MTFDMVWLIGSIICGVGVLICAGVVLGSASPDSEKDDGLVFRIVAIGAVFIAFWWMLLILAAILFAVVSPIMIIAWITRKIRDSRNGEQTPATAGGVIPACWRRMFRRGGDTHAR